MKDLLNSEPRLKNLRAHAETWSPTTRTLIEGLLEEDQAHLFYDWDPPGIADEKKARFLTQLSGVEDNYPGGLRSYLSNSRLLLREAQQGLNPFEGALPEKPEGVDCTAFDARYDQLEARGTAQFERTGIVMVAGGLGERLGFDGIKIDIPVESIEQTSYLAHYASVILAMEARMQQPRKMPFIIMVSADTQVATQQALEEHHFFGLDPAQVHILRQELVPALTDNQAHLALEEPYELLMKPHGHGDIHMLLHQSGLARQLCEEGIEHLVFIQDTNGQVFNAIPAALGVACEEAFDFTSLAVNRIPGEAVGGLAKLVWPQGTKTLNVEYNQLDPLLRATVSPAGDLPNEEGYSFFPGNINVLIIALRAYVEVLEQSQGIIAEFVNPKYSDVKRSHFKKPTRLETMMQDLPKLFEQQERVGVAIFDRTWSFSANKNSVADAAAKQRDGGPAESAATAEADFYAAGRARLRAAGFEVAEQAPCCVQDISFVSGPQVILRPSFAMSVDEVREKTGGGVLEAESTLILDGADITLGHVELAAGAALVIEAVPGAHVHVEGRFENEGFERVLLSPAACQDRSIPETVRMRGYRYEDRGAAIYRFDAPGVYRIEP